VGDDGDIADLHKGMRTEKRGLELKKAVLYLFLAAQR